MRVALDLPLLGANELRRYGRNLPNSFEVELEEGKRLVIEKILRLLPGKRLTAKARLGHRTVLAKVFFARFGSRRCLHREKKGLDLLNSRTFPAPDLLGEYSLAGRKKAGVLLVEYLDASISVKERWQSVFHEKTGNPAQMEILEPLFTQVGVMHALGLCQKDLHLNNFLWHEGKLKAVDGDGIAFCVSLRQQTTNLGLLLSQFPLALTEHIPELLAAYQRGSKTTLMTPEKLRRATQKQRNQGLDVYLAKTLRDCSEFVVTKNPHHFSSTVRTFSPWLEELIRDPDSMMAAGDPLKLGGTATVVRLNLEGHQIVVKRYNQGNPWRYLKRCWRPSRARRSWLNGHCLKSLGINTPRPLALIEERQGPLCKRSWLVTEFIDGITIFDLMARYPQSEPPLAVKDSLQKLFSAMNQARVTHGDMKGTNLIWYDNQFWLLDLDAMKWHKNNFTFKKAWEKDCRRFADNWNKPLSFAFYSAN